MNKISLSRIAVPVVSLAALIVASTLTVATVAQNPQQPPMGGPQQPRSYPAPTNLKVLPKDLSGKEVRDIMEKWEGDLGAECSTCHVADPNNIGPNGKPRLNFADDSKPEKQMARIMYTMTEDMKKNYVAKVEALDKMPDHAAELTCGTCHRGKIDPDAFVPVRHQRPGGAPAGGPPAAGAPAPPPAL